MAIPKSQWQRRLKAALEVTGQDMKDLPEVWEGFVKNAPQRANHDSDGYRASDALAGVVADYFGLPKEWFTVEGFAEWISRASTPAAGIADLADELRGVRMEVRGGLSAVRTEQERQRQLLEQLGDGEGSAGSG